jgi:hypothetical protein
MKNTVIINLVASPCSGKSTLACELFVHFKKLHMDVEYITEIAKDLIWKNQMDKLNDQYYVSCEQYKILKSVYGKVDYIICDSPLFMSLFYNYYNENNFSDILKTSRWILDSIHEFRNNFYIFIKRNKNLEYRNIGRIHSEEESSDIEEKIEYLLKCCDISYFEMTTGESHDVLMEKLIKLHS